jgi:hypothetical protein
VVLSIEERVFLVEYVFREGKRNTDLVQEQFAEKFPETPASHLRSAESVCEYNLTGSGLYRRSWASHPTAFICAQRLSERTVLLQNRAL